jgi:hypothetical protein
MKTYIVHARLPMTTEARNAGATGRRYWWAYCDTLLARNAKHACAIHRRSGRFAQADKLRAVLA